MECKKLRNLFAVYIFFLGSLVSAAAPEESAVEGQTEAATENAVDEELTSGEEMADEADLEEEEIMGVTVEPGTPFEVPALIDRPLDIEEGPYVVVN